MIKAVLFDLDGTLLNTLTDLQVSVNTALKSVDAPVRSLEEIRAFVGDGAVKLCERALGDLKEPALTGRVLTAFRAHYADNMDVETAPYPGVIKLLIELKRTGIARAVVSNKYDAAVQKICTRYFPDLIDIAVGEGNGMPPKPAPDSTLHAMESLAIASEEAIYVGDTDVDVMTATNAGLACIGVTWGFRSRSVLERAGVAYIVDTADDLLKMIRGL